MIQRIQTLYLLVSVILLGLLFALPFAEIVKDGLIYLFNFKGVSFEGVIKQNGVIVSVLIAILLVLHGFAISDYKKRARQIVVIKYAVFGLLAMLGMFFFFTAYSYNGFPISYKPGFIFPLIAIILDFLAMRAIKKDEALIRSIDRIR
jgi:hypothetical protein